MIKSCLLLSSGIDSSSALFLYEPDYAITINLNSRYSNWELLSLIRIKEVAKKVGLKTKFITLNDTVNLSKYEQKDATIMLRNMYLLMLATNEMFRIEPDLFTLRLMLITQKDEMNIPDRTISFLNKSSELLSDLTGKQVFCFTPFENIDKTKILSELIKKRGIEFANWLYIISYSCYESKSGIECGNCPACFRKWVAGINNNIFQDIFEIDPFYSDIKNIYLSNLNKYSKDRQNRILDAIEIYKKIRNIDCGTV